MNVMNLFSTSPQFQLGFTNKNLNNNWQNSFQATLRQDLSYSSFNQTNSKEQSEPLSFEQILETFKLTEEELIDLLQLINELIGKGEQIKETDMITLKEASTRIKNEKSSEVHLDDKDIIESLQLNAESKEIDETISNNLEMLNDLLMKLLSYNEADYDEFLATIAATESFDTTIKEQIRQFILALQLVNINGFSMENEDPFIDRFESKNFRLLNNNLESHPEVRKEGTEIEELIFEDKVALEDQAEAIQSEVIQLVTEINRLLDGFMEKGTDLPRNILQILHRWAQLQEDAPRILAEVKEKQLSEKDSKIWQQLVQIYGKRQSFSKQLIYQTESSMTKQDVHRWLEQAFSQYDQVASQSQSQPATTVSQTMLPMSEVQQFEVHLQATNRVEKISNNLLTQLTNVIKKSNFIQGRQMNQLTITLNPVNLGNITVRLVEVDGEMTVKLLVTSNLTKNALETNIHQLKHVFSPHQISIEREEGISDEEFFADEEALEDEMYEEGNETEEDEEISEIDFEELLQQVKEGEEVDDEN